MPSVPDSSKDASLYALIQKYIREKKSKKGNVYIGVFQRLDRPVSGIIAYCLRSKCSKRMNEAMKRGDVKKLYLAVSEGAPCKMEKGKLGIHKLKAGAEGVERIYIKKLSRDNIVKIAGEYVPKNGNKLLKGAQLAVTWWKLLYYDKKRDMSLFLLRPYTGRSHQLRATLAYMGCPIVGDRKYGASRIYKEMGYGEIALHSFKLLCIHPVKREKMCLSVPPLRWPFSMFEQFVA